MDTNDYNRDVARPRLTTRDLLHSIFKRFGLFVGIPVVIIVVVVIASLTLPPIYQASTALKIEDTKYEEIGLIGSTRISSDFFLRKEQHINSEINIVRSSTVLEAVVQRLDLWRRWTASGKPKDERVRNAVSTLYNELEVEPSRDSWVINISYSSTDRELAADIVNTVSEEYIKQNIAQNILPQAAGFYEEKLEQEKAKLERLQRDFRTLKEERHVVVYDAEMEQKLLNRASFEEQLIEVKKEILSKRAKVRKINDFLRENVDVLIPIPEIAAVRIVEDLNYRLANLSLELKALRKKYTDREQQVQNIAAQISSVENQLRIEVRKILDQETTDLNKLEAERDALQSSIEDINVELLTIQEAEAPYKNLEREIHNKEGIITELSKKYTDSLYAGQSDTRIGKVKQISPAIIPTTPVFPNLGLNLLVGIPLAILIGLAIVIFLDYFDHTLPTPEKVESALRLPVLASINRFNPKRKPVFR